MMRYQRVSPDCLPLSNGRKPTLRTCKEDESDSNGRIPNYSSPFDGKAVRARAGSGSGSANPSDRHFPHFSVSSSDPLHPDNQTAASAAAAAIAASAAVAVSTASASPALKAQSHHEINGRCTGGGGDVLLQWGHNKRSRGSRVESRAVGDESSVHSRQMIKIQRRAAIAGAEKMAAAAMPPPPCASLYTRGANLRPCMPLLNRTVEDRSGGQPRSEKRSPPSPPDKAHHSSKMASAASSVPNGCGSDAAGSMNPESKPPSDQETGGNGGGAEKVNLEHFEWPRIYISLSRKEKEDDFLAMKGTKLPQRPKKRAKNIDKALQYCFPGMWLSDLTRGRYEVREKKCVKKKRRGLKGMESMDSDSE